MLISMITGLTNWYLHFLLFSNFSAFISKQSEWKLCDTLKIALLLKITTHQSAYYYSEVPYCKSISIKDKGSGSFFFVLFFQVALSTLNTCCKP